MISTTELNSDYMSKHLTANYVILFTKMYLRLVMRLKTHQAVSDEYDNYVH